MPLGQASGFPQADPGGRVTPRFWHRLIRFRHFIDGSLALASLNLACRNLVPAFPQRSPPSLLTTAACGGLRPEPDCRPRRALLHLSYSSAPPYSCGAFVTHDPFRTSEGAHRAAKPPILRPRAWISRGARQVPRKPAGGNRPRSTDWHLPGHSFAGSSLRRPHSHAYSSNRLSSLASLRAWPCVVPAKG